MEEKLTVEWGLGELRPADVAIWHAFELTDSTPIFPLFCRLLKK